MDRLTVEHEYDPETGFIVAKRTVGLPPIIASGPPLDEAIRRGASEGQLVIAFATADRCAPCQQYKLDALNDDRVIARLSKPALLVTHVEVDSHPELAERHLGGRGVPMTYALRGGERVATLRGQRSAEELLEWLDQLETQN
jgi:thioredoxin-like negative regulator of GroEL